MDEVSDVEEWQNIHYGYAHDVQSDPQGEDEAGLETARSRSRGSARDEPQAKTMPKPLAQQVKGRIALDTAWIWQKRWRTVERLLDPQHQLLRQLEILQQAF